MPQITRLVDSHCHLDRIPLEAYEGDLGRLLEAARAAGVAELLCVSIDLESYPDMLARVQDLPGVWISVGVHPNDRDRREPGVEELIELASHPRNVAIGETGLDYHYHQGDLGWQQQRFRTHIRAACQAGKPIIVHTREAREDTIAIMREEGAECCGGVMHCFTESWEMAEAALELGFYISFSGIVTFRNAEALREVAARVPLDRLLIETDSPYLAPTPYRGKPNEPKYLPRVLETLADLRELPTEALAEQLNANFAALFRTAARTS